eukprot:TRINITY_DN13420_c0_g1_i1.p1 TRINITY_DN13420_c0_g1~~TRINITY_DN13420_c0_g1_i1.p1  ORF type:complete len:189 (-),score=77.49 TRINITY_DN13420_c0_g1_i1:125-613(-)
MNLDKDKNGSLDKKELVAFSTAAYKIAKKDGEVTGESVSKYIDGLWSSIDTNKDGTVSYEEFENYIIKRNNDYFLAAFKKAVAGDAAAAREAFNRIDVDKNGQLTLNEFKAVATELIKTEEDSGTDLDMYVRSIFLKHDADNNGFINIDEFFDILKIDDTKA